MSKTNTLGKTCPKKCKYLISDLGCCSHPMFKNAKVLKRTKTGLLRVCSAENKSDLITLKEPKKNKYSAHSVIDNGIKYDSISEMRRHQELLFMQSAGEIQDVKFHEEFILIEKSQFGREIKYEADFTYYKNGKKVVEDVKSDVTRTRLYMLKKRLFAEKYGFQISEIFMT